MIFFRNLCLFRFSKTAAEAIEDNAFVPQLKKHALKPCGALETQTKGWISPYGRGEETLVHAMGTFSLLTLGIESKLLPAAVVNEELASKLEALQAQRGENRISGRERKRLKDEVLLDLLPKAFVAPSRLSGYLDHRSGWLLIDTSSRKSAEGFLTVLRESLGHFPATLLDPEESPKSLMTNWLMGDKLPPGFELGDECELTDPTDRGAVVRCRRQDLDSEEIRQHLKSGKQVTQLGLVISDHVSFVLTEDLTIRKLKFLDVVTEEIEKTDRDSYKDELDASFAVMSLTLKTVLERLDEVFRLPRPHSRERKTWS